MEGIRTLKVGTGEERRERMTAEEFRKYAEGRLLLLDGATGSNLIKRGMPEGVCPERWILENPEILISLQKEFVNAGSRILYAPTFSANAIKLAEYGLRNQVQSMNRELVALSKEAAQGKCLIAGDLTMTGQQLSPLGSLDFEELVDVYKEQIHALAEAGVDLLVTETMMSLQESRAALIAAKESCDLPVMVSMTFEADGRTLYGTNARTAAVVLESLGAAAVGANCSTGPDRMVPIISAMAAVTSVPILAKPNAGLPALNSRGETVYDMDSDVFARNMKALVEAGASLLGGCCGATPEYIRRLREETDGMPVRVRAKSGRHYLSSERKTLEFDLDGPLIIVGERINPTGKKKLQESLREGSMELVCQYAEEQEERGAGVLDVNMGMSGINEKDLMLQALSEVESVTSLPLAMDSSHVDVMEAALRRYPGRALINSVSCEKEKLDRILPLAKKYGAMFILLPLSDEGLPEDLEERKRLIDRIVSRAKELGLGEEDFVVDGLVATVGADKRAALETLATIRYCREKNYATLCGLSNISFGLPERGYINAAFLTMAIHEGLTMAIANPSQELLMNSAFAADLLLAKEGADLRYIEQMNAGGGKEQEAERNSSCDAELNSTCDAERNSTCKAELNSTYKAELNSTYKAELNSTYKAVLLGNRQAIAGLVAQAVEQGNAPQEILDRVLLPAINEVGDRFDKGKYFLPQLIAGAETMKIAIEYLEPLLAREKQAREMPAIVIATVQGDIHDIGKNLVALMLKNYGFRVIDLGKDVPKERIIEAARESHASVIALSALMTTTMQEMKRVIAYAREQGVDARIIIGGAVITQDYAEEIGADGYSKDAADAVKLVQRILGV